MKLSNPLKLLCEKDNGFRLCVNSSNLSGLKATGSAPAEPDVKVHERRRTEHDGSQVRGGEFRWFKGLLQNFNLKDSFMPKLQLQSNFIMSFEKNLHF